MEYCLKMAFIFTLFQYKLLDFDSMIFFSVYSPISKGIQSLKKKQLIIILDKIYLYTNHIQFSKVRVDLQLRSEGYIINLTMLL